MPGAALFGALDQGGGRAGGAHVAGDEVVDHPGDRQPGLLGAALDRHQAGSGRAVHVEPAPIGPRAAGPVTGDRDADQPGIPFGQLARIQAQPFQLAGPVVVDHDVGAGEQLAGQRPAAVAGEVHVGGAGAEVGFGVDEVVLVVVGAGCAQDVRALLGQRPADRRPGDRMRERQHPHTLQRTLRGRDSAGRCITDAFQADHRLAGQPRALGVC
jgi:hypothetical protein